MGWTLPHCGGGFGAQVSLANLNERYNHPDRQFHPTYDVDVLRWRMENEKQGVIDRIRAYKKHDGDAKALLDELQTLVKLWDDCRAQGDDDLSVRAFDKLILRDGLV